MTPEADLPKSTRRDVRRFMECQEHGRGPVEARDGKLVMTRCGCEPVEVVYVRAEPTDEMIERAARRLAGEHRWDDPAGMDDGERGAWRGEVRDALAAAFSTQHEGGAPR